MNEIFATWSYKDTCKYMKCIQNTKQNMYHKKRNLACFVQKKNGRRIGNFQHKFNLCWKISIIWLNFLSTIIMSNLKCPPKSNIVNHLETKNRFLIIDTFPILFDTFSILFSILFSINRNFIKIYKYIKVL